MHVGQNISYPSNTVKSVKSETPLPPKKIVWQMPLLRLNLSNHIRKFSVDISELHTAQTLPPHSFVGIQYNYTYYSLWSLSRWSPFHTVLTIHNSFTRNPYLDQSGIHVFIKFVFFYSWFSFLCTRESQMLYHHVNQVILNLNVFHGVRITVGTKRTLANKSTVNLLDYC